MNNPQPGPVPVHLAQPWAKDAEGVHRALLADGRSVWIWREEPGEWRYGLVRHGEDVPNAFTAPRLHLAKADCLALAGWLSPGARPSPSAFGPHWSVHPVTGAGAKLHNPPSG